MTNEEMLKATSGYDTDAIDGVIHSNNQKMEKKEAIKKNLTKAIEMLGTGNTCEALLHAQEASQDLVYLRCECKADVARNAGLESGC